MFRLNGFIQKQGQYLLENKWHAMLHAILLAVLPYTAWLSVALIALVTLRRGWRDGGWLLIPATLTYLSASLTSTTAYIATIDTLLVFIPCYLAACCLRMTASWRVVAGVFFVLIFTVMLSLQVWAQEFIMAQSLYFQTLLREIQTESSVLAFINDKTTLNQVVFANYLLGIQALGIVFSASLPLMFARSVQSQIFYPGGFKQEMLNFRGEKIELFLLVFTFVCASQHNAFAMCILPALMFYFLLAGLSLSVTILKKQKPLITMLFFATTFFLLPFVMLPVCIMLGTMDSLFNFRFYLPSDAGKTI